MTPRILWRRRPGSSPRKQLSRTSTTRTRFRKTLFRFILRRSPHLPGLPIFPHVGYYNDLVDWVKIDVLGTFLEPCNRLKARILLDFRRIPPASHG